MISEAGSSDFPAGTGDFPAGSCRKPSENGRIWKQEYGARIRWPVMFGSGWFSLETGKTGHRIRTSYSCFHVPAISRVFRPEPVRTLRPGYSPRFNSNITATYI